MAQPVALFLYEKLLPGGQLVNRLEDLGYRVPTLSNPAELLPEAEQQKPLLVIVDLEPQGAAVCDAIARLRKNQETSHLPIIAIARAGSEELQEQARSAGATLVVNDQAILLHLNELLQQALQID